MGLTAMTSTSLVLMKKEHNANYFLHMRCGVLVPLFLVSYVLRPWLQFEAELI
jgi:hypothetical protein